jgi:hypothetical protein
MPEGLIDMRIAKAATILVLGPLIGVFLGFIIGALATPSDPNFVANGSHGSPGDGFLVMGLAALGFFASVPESIVLTRKVLRRPRSAESESDQLN